jgi:hypothetical protein
MDQPRRRKFKFIGCEIAYREACYLAAVCRNQVDVQFLPKGLHSLETSEMAARVQAAVDAVPADAGYEAVLLGYARCNDGVVGVTARRLPLVIPRAHDCVTLFFGSRGAYRAYFDAHPGTYYMTTGWAERDKDHSQAELPPGGGTASGKLGRRMSYDDLVAKYGRDNADYITRTLGDWRKNYSRMLYLKMGICEEEDYVERTRAEAARHDWQFDLRPGDLGLLEKLFSGEWDEDFVVVQPGRRIVARNDERVLDAE